MRWCRAPLHRPLLRVDMGLTQTRASLLIVLGGCMWGVYWLPLRHLEGVGFTGASAGIALYIGCLVVLLPFTLRFGATIRTQWRVLLFSSLLTGAAFSLFTTALALTDVIRAILLFYLTPAWSTILGLLFLGERLDRARILALLFAFVGLAVILGGNGGIPIPRTTGDIFALLSGIFWAVGSMGLLKAPDIPARVQVFGFFLGALALSLITLFVMQGQGGVPISVSWGPNRDWVCFDLHALHDPDGVPDNPARHGPPPRTHRRVADERGRRWRHIRRAVVRRGIRRTRSIGHTIDHCCRIV